MVSFQLYLSLGCKKIKKIKEKSNDLSGINSWSEFVSF